MDQTDIKRIIEATLLAVGRPLPFEKLVEIFTSKGEGLDRSEIRSGLEALAADYEERGIELKEVSSGFRIQVRSSMADWLQPLWEERAPRYTRALLETLALIAYRQPITRGEIEEVRGVAVSSNIVRTLMERGWIRVVGHRDVPGKPAMLGTTREFLDYFGLKKLEDLPTLTEFDEEHPESSPQGDFIESLDGDAEAEDTAAETVGADTGTASVESAEAPADDDAVIAFAAAADDDEPAPDPEKRAAAADDDEPAPDPEKHAAAADDDEPAPDPEERAVAAGDDESAPNPENHAAAADDDNPARDPEEHEAATSGSSDEAAAVFRALADNLGAERSPATGDDGEAERSADEVEGMGAIAEPAEPTEPTEPGEEDEADSSAGPAKSPAAGQSGSGQL